MSEATSTNARAENAKRNEKGKEAPGKPVFEALGAGELFWQPYRSMSRALLCTHRNIERYMEVNRALSDEMQGILRRAQDMTVEMSEKVTQHTRAVLDVNLQAPADHLGRFDELYNFAIESVCELGSAVIAAQIRSLEVLRDHAQAVAKRAKEEDR